MFLKIQKRSLAFLLALILVLSTFVSVAVIPASAAEADVAETGGGPYSYLNGLVSISGQNELDLPVGFEEVTTTGSYQATVTYVEYGMMEQDGSGSVVVTNNSTNDVSFTYNVACDDGNVYFDDVGYAGYQNNELTGSDTFVLGAGASKEFFLITTWWTAQSAYATLTFTDFHEIIPVAGYATVSNDSHATIVANSKTLENSTESIGFNAVDGLTLQATPDAGYGFLAWIDPDTGEEVSSENPAVFHPESDIKVAPVIYANAGTTGNYGVKVPGFTNEAVFDTLALALAYKSEVAGRVISVLRDVTYTENCTIPADTTLLVPFDDAHTVYREDPENNEPEVINEYTTPTAYAVMTMATGSSLTVADGGELCLGSKLCAKGQINGWNGAPTGPDGRICMKGNSKITVNNGGNLYAWGYIYRSAANDEGQVIAKNGATVYEPFQIKNFRGGSSTLAIYKDTFPFNQYYIQNIEVPLKVEAGAKEIGLGAITGGGMTVACGVTFIGEGGLFVMDEGYLIKDYIETEDRLDIQIYGDSQLSSMEVSIYGVDLDTSAYPLPITNNITVELKQGDLSINQDITMLPGTELVISEGTSMTIEEGTEVYVYDADQWNGQNYAGGTATSNNFVPVGYSVANGKNQVRTDSDIVDAQVDINGDVMVNGGFYCTDTGNVSSSQQKGTITYATDAATSATLAECQGTAESTVPVNFCVAQLRKPGYDAGTTDPNAYVSPVTTDPDNDTTYFVTGEYEYGNNDLVYADVYLVQWLDYEGDPNEPLYEKYYKTGDVPVYVGEEPTHEDTYEYLFEGSFQGWATSPLSDTGVYTCYENLPAVETANVTYYAAYDEVSEVRYTIYWKNGSTQLMKLNNKKYSEINSELYTGDTPTKRDEYIRSFDSSTKGYEFTEYRNKAIKKVSTFDHWDKDFNFASRKCTFTAQFSTTDYYLVLFLNEAQDQVESAQYFQLDEPIKPGEVYAGTAPTKEGYVFSGWRNLNNDEYPLGSDTEYYVQNPDDGAYYSNKNTFVPTFVKTDKHSLSLNGDIGVNFYHKLPAEYANAAITADFSWGKSYVTTNTYNDTPKTQAVNTYTVTDDGYIKFTLPIAIKELNDVISVSYKADGVEIATDTFTPSAYAYEILGMSDADITPLLKYDYQTPAELREVARTMLIYAAKAQENFNYNTEHLATYDLDDTSIATVVKDDLGSNNLNDLPDYLEYYGSSLNLGSKTAYDLCFINSSKTALDTSATYANSDEEVGTAVRSNDIAYVVRLEDLPAAKVTENISLTINGSTVTVNAGEYIKAVLDNYNSGALYDTVTALYAYNQSAVAFFS